MERKIASLQSLVHQHSIIYDYVKGEILCSECGTIVRDKIYDREASNDFCKHKSDTNSVLPASIMLHNQDMSTIIAEYDVTSYLRSANRKEHNKIKFLNQVVSGSNNKRNLKNCY